MHSSGKQRRERSILERHGTRNERVASKTSEDTHMVSVVEFVLGNKRFECCSDLPYGSSL